MQNLILHDNPIRKISIVDDNDEARNAMSEIVIDAGFIPIPQTEIQHSSLDEFTYKIMQDSDGAIFDYNLSPGNYAKFDGAEAVVQLYDMDFPAILLTQVQGYDSVKIVSKRKKIPCFINNFDGDANQLREGFERCVRELKNDIPPDRRAYKTIARVASIDLSDSHRKIVSLILPAWAPTKPVQLPHDYVFNMVNVELRPNMHLLADVNIGANCYLDLFIENIEVAKEIDDELAELIRT